MRSIGLVRVEIREIHLRASDGVNEVGEHELDRECDDLEDLRVVVSRAAECIDVIIGHVTAFLDESACKIRSGSDGGVARRPARFRSITSGGVAPDVAARLCVRGSTRSH
jgi:hypothetical protein